VFFGRERLVAEMVARLAGAPLMAIVGPSGSGKSSACAPGCSPRWRGVLPGLERWAIALLRPGAHPLRALEPATERRRAARCWRSTSSRSFHRLPRRGRARRVRRRARRARGGRARQTLVLIAVRADFYGHCAAYPELARLAAPTTCWSADAPRRAAARDRAPRAARRAARRPRARRRAGGGRRRRAGRPAAAVLVAARALAAARRAAPADVRYEQAGGVRGAVARLAERAYARLEPERQEIARRILLRLAGRGRATRSCAVASRSPSSRAPVSPNLGGARRRAPGDRRRGEVEVAHEALLREWPRLRGWLRGGRRGAPRARAR
jgi:hypothetical protein